MPTPLPTFRGFCSRKCIFLHRQAYIASGDDMLAVPIRINRCKRIWLVAAVVLIAVAGIFAGVRALQRHPSATTSQNGCRYTTDVSNGDFAAFFRQLNLTVADAPAARETVQIPGEFNAVYSDYNALQRQSGLDLLPYQGKDVWRLTFSMQTGGCATLLVYKGRVIGGHQTNGEYGSGLQPLTK